MKIAVRETATLSADISRAGRQRRVDGRKTLPWFGPRGLASIVFLIIVFNEKIAGEETLAVTVVRTTALSVLLRGLSANPLAKRCEAASGRSEPDTAEG